MYLYIAFYLYISIALFAAHNNQKRFQCERTREKRAVVIERKEALGSPVEALGSLVSKECLGLCDRLLE